MAPLSILSLHRKMSDYNKRGRHWLKEMVGRKAKWTRLRRKW